MKALKRRRKVLALGGVAAALVVLGAGTVAIEAQGVSPLTPANVAEKLGSKLRPAPAMRPGETREQYRQRLLGELKPGARLVDIREETRGKPITIAGKSIQLPPDAYVEAVVTDVTCGPRPCPETPGYVIVRGRSRIAVGIATGRINAETIAAGEQGTFDFLKEALR